MIADVSHLGGGSKTKLDILIVEDEPTARRALRLLLIAHGYETDAVSSAEDALELMERDGIPRVALVDLNLPGMDGLELIRRLEVLSPTTYSVLVTAVDRAALHRSLDRTMAYMQKPVDFGRLLTIIQQRPA